VCVLVLRCVLGKGAVVNPGLAAYTPILILLILAGVSVFSLVKVFSV
jgi:hypothetical protein